jgi:hypothetical protein
MQCRLDLLPKLELHQTLTATLKTKLFIQHPMGLIGHEEVLRMLSFCH